MTKKESNHSVEASLLEQIHSPDDLKALPQSQMEALAAEIRSYLIRHVTETGGHLASNLGAVELSLAIHRVFSTPKDHLAKNGSSAELSLKSGCSARTTFSSPLCS